jgi:adenine C2-methylase RlmN of 23S rRNA A2503 and tRNA A37
MLARAKQFTDLFPHEPAFRLKQIHAALFDDRVSAWSDVTTFGKSMRDLLQKDVPFMSVREHKVYTSEKQDTYKALLLSADNRQFETVLMQNKKGQWTICVSSQIGCAMRCTFCATGTMGLKRSLLADEIVDQYRFWRQFLRKKGLPGRISNVVFMGMGEPMANYENVKEAIHTWLDYTDVGSTKITVSTVGILTQLTKLLTDPDWPPVRIAISLHSANQAKREEIVPTTVPNFLKDLIVWTHKYAETHGNRKHHITFEYTVLSGVNDTPELAKELGKYVAKTGYTKVNIIPYNPVVGKLFTRSDEGRREAFKEILRSFGVDVTERKTMGDDIAAACGQLVVENAESQK